jgi:hypothetical protein
MTKPEGQPAFQPGPNAEQIRKQATRVIVGRVPMQVRRELNAAVKAGYLGHLKKDGLKPEIYFDPAHRNGAIERQAREAAYSVSCIAKVIASPADVREGIERSGGDVLAYTLNEQVAKAVSTSTPGQVPGALMSTMLARTLDASPTTTEQQQEKSE